MSNKQTNSENKANIQPLQESQQGWFDWLKDNKFAVIFVILLLVAAYYWFSSGSSVDCLSDGTPIPDIVTTTPTKLNITRTR